MITAYPEKIPIAMNDTSIPPETITSSTPIAKTRLISELVPRSSSVGQPQNDGVEMPTAIENAMIESTSTPSLLRPRSRFQGIDLTRRAP